MTKPWTIAEVERLLPNAKKVADGLGVPHDDAPIYLGYISTTPPSPEVLERGRELAEKFGWTE
jgi:hypothetical protein